MVVLMAGYLADKTAVLKVVQWAVQTVVMTVDHLVEPTAVRKVQRWAQCSAATKADNSAAS